MVILKSSQRLGNNIVQFSSKKNSRKPMDKCTGCRNITEILIKPPKQALPFTCVPDMSFENTVGKGEIVRNEHFSFLYARQRRDVLCDHPWRTGVQACGRRSVLCPEHIYK